jgi:type II secretory pathway pseudopilin PulG
MSWNFTKLRTISLKTSASESSQGFTTVEVLVGLLLTIIFMGVAMQMMVVSTALRVRAQEASESSNWVQADLISVSSQAEALGGYNETTDVYTNLDSTKCNATTSTAGYARVLQDQLDTNRDVTGTNLRTESNNESKLSTIGGRPYTLRRVTRITTARPNVLEVSYSVFRGTNTTGSCS